MKESAVSASPAQIVVHNRINMDKKHLAMLEDQAADSKAGSVHKVSGPGTSVGACAGGLGGAGVHEIFGCDVCGRMLWYSQNDNVNSIAIVCTKPFA